MTKILDIVAELLFCVVWFVLLPLFITVALS